MRPNLQKHRSECRDTGFTLIEIILAMFIVVALMTAVLGLVVSALGTLAQARQRQAGSALATQSLESIRAVAYATATGGSSLGCDAALGLTSTADYVTAGPPITFAPPSTVISVPVEPLMKNTQSPCSLTVQADNTTYTVRQYVTRSTTSGGFNLTAITTWPRFGGGQGVAVERSTTYSPGGCLLDTLHPFSGPCQPAFSARGDTDVMSVSVTRRDVNPLVPPALVGTLTVAGASSNVAVEQTVSVGSVAIGAGGSGSTGVGAPAAVVLAANSDPTSTSPRTYVGSPNWSGTSVAPTPLSMMASASSGSLAGDIASGSTTCLMPTVTGTQVAISTGASTELRPCGYSKESLPGVASLTLSSVSLFDIASVSNFVGAAHIFKGTNGAGVCGANAPGCARSSAYRSIASTVFAPGVTSAVSTGMWRITGLQESALAERGAVASTPTGSRSGTLLLWDGATHVSIPLAQNTEGTWTWGEATGFPAVTTGGLMITGTLTVTKASSPIVTPLGCLESACQGTRQGGAISGSFTVTSPDGTFEVDVNLGGVSAVAGYQAAPVG